MASSGSTVGSGGSDRRVAREPGEEGRPWLDAAAEPNRRVRDRESGERRLECRSLTPSRGDGGAVGFLPRQTGSRRGRQDFLGSAAAVAQRPTFGRAAGPFVFGADRVRGIPRQDALALVQCGHPLGDPGRGPTTTRPLLCAGGATGAKAQPFSATGWRTHIRRSAQRQGTRTSGELRSLFRASCPSGGHRATQPGFPR